MSTPASSASRWTAITSRRVIAIVGPTGVGKSAIADGAARQLNAEIVSADSMQVYRGMDIGTAKAPAARRTVPYHCLDLVDPGEPYSAALYQRDAREAIDGILERGALPVVVGGTGLYVRAALDEMAFPPGSADTPGRERLESLAAEIGPEALHARLELQDPASAALIHPNNVRRVVRALEMAERGLSYADQHAGFADRRSVYDSEFVGITMDRDALYERIDERVDLMLEHGLVEEVGRLLDAGYRDALTAGQAIGYKELVGVLESGEDLTDAVAAIQQATRKYAKRQLTWFSADPRVRWVDVTGLSTDEAVDAALALIESHATP